MPDLATGEAYPLNWVRAALELAILGLLRTEPAHGYAITTKLAEAGFGKLRGGSIYPVLTRLEDAGHVESRWVEPQAGPGRKDYTITDAGRARLDREALIWDDFAAAVRRITSGPSQTQKDTR